MKKENKKIGLLILGLVSFFSLFLADNVAATTVPDTVKYKAAYEGVYQCYTNGAYEETFLAKKGGAGMIKDPLSDDAVKLPYGLTNAADNNANCKEILKGFKDKTNSNIDNLRAGLLQPRIYSNSEDNNESYSSLNSIDVTKVKNYFSGVDGKGGDGTMGYSAEEVSEVKEGQDSSRVRISFTNNGEAIAKYCHKSNSGLKLAGDPYIFDSQGNRVSEIIFPAIAKLEKEEKPWWNPSGWFEHEQWESDLSGINVPQPGSRGDVTYYFCNNDSYVTILNTGSKEVPYYEIHYTIANYDENGKITMKTGDTFHLQPGNDGWNVTGNHGDLLDVEVTSEKVDQTGGFNDYTLKFNGNKMRAITKLSETSAAGYKLAIDKSKGYGTLALSNAEIYSLYTYYVKDVFKYPVVCEGDADFSNYNDSNSKEIKWAKEKKCRIYTQAKPEEPKYKVYGINNNTKHFTREVNIDDIIDGLNMLPDSVFDEVADAEAGGTIGANGDGSSADGDDDSEAASCFTDGDALGWIICPVLKMAGSAASAVYDSIISDWLRMDVTFFNTDGDNAGVYTGWTQFRDLANIIFAIFFIIIILAQVTGIGVSNYNIKKILPKLIVVVILVNASFLICQLAVDLSNILGNSLYNMLEGLPTGSGDTGFGLDNLIVSLLSTVGVAVIGGAAATGFVIAAITNPGAVLIPLLLAILSALIGLLFFFIILAVRKAGVVVLVVLAPIAIVCYALPNTKSFFDKWKKLFTALLLVYPICSVLMGGGYFVSNLMLKSGDNGFVESLVAMLLQVVPIFFVPAILKSSLAVAGNIGAKISNFGSRLSGNATGALRNANTTQRLTTSMNNWGATKGQKAVGAINRGLGHIPGVGRLQRSRLGRAIGTSHDRKIAQSKVAYRKMKLDEGSNSFLAQNMTAASLESDLAAQEYKQQQELIDRDVQSILSGNMSGVDANDLSSLSTALNTLSSQYNATGDAQVGNRMNAVARVMIDKHHGKGWQSVLGNLKQDADTSGNFSRSDSFRSLSQYINRDDKWMSKLKKEDPGAFDMVSDGAKTSGTMGNLFQYNAPKASKVTASSVPDLSDDFYDGYQKAIASAETAGAFTAGSANYNPTQFDDMIQNFERAAADPRISPQIKTSDLNEMNKIKEQVYNAKRDAWKAANVGKTDADYEAAFGKNQAITIGQSMKINHKTMPGGWRRATTTDMIAHPGIGLSEGDWIDTSGRTPTRLSAADQKRAEAIESYNINTDINNTP